MKEFKGTPGPWVKDSWNVIGPGGRKVMFGCLTLSGRTNAEVTANDNLALAAPELLSVLQKIVESGHILPHLKIESQWAIVKALGESK